MAETVGHIKNERLDSIEGRNIRLKLRDGSVMARHIGSDVGSEVIQPLIDIPIRDLQRQIDGIVGPDVPEEGINTVSKVFDFLIGIDEHTTLRQLLEDEDEKISALGESTLEAVEQLNESISQLREYTDGELDKKANVTDVYNKEAIDDFMAHVVTGLEVRPNGDLYAIYGYNNGNPATGG